MGKFADELLPKFADDPKPTLADFKPYTVAWVIQRVLDDVASNPEMKQYGESHYYALLALQRRPIASKDARKLGRADIIEHCKWRRAGGAGKKVGAATVNQDLTYLRGVLEYANSTWPDCEEVKIGAIAEALPYLRKHGLTGKSIPRKRRPTDEEIERLLAYFVERNSKPRVEVKAMPDIIAFALVSSRRRGEICRITHGDVDYEKKIYWVRDLKHPTKKKGNDKSFILWPELEQIIRRQPRMNPSDPSERIFPFNGKSVGMIYTEGKKALGIQNLRFHDNRRDAISKWLLKMPPEDVRIAVSGHDNTKILETNYDGRNSLELIREKHSGLVQANAP